MGWDIAGTVTASRSTTVGGFETTLAVNHLGPFLLTNLLDFGSGPDGPRWMGLAMRMLKPFLATPETGASTSVLLATAPDEQLDAGVYWSSGQAKEPSAQALDPDAARRLWESSADLVDLRADS